MIIGIILIGVGVLISMFGLWRDVIFRKVHTRFRKITLYTIGAVIVIIGLINICLFVKTSKESNRLQSERLILTDLKVKFEILCSMKEGSNIGHIMGSPLILNVYSKKDTLLAPFYLSSPFVWDIMQLPSEQIRANIFFCADPEMPLIGKRIVKLEQYDAIEYPLGMIAKSLNLKKASQIIKTVEAIYINGLEIRRVETPIEYTWGDSDMVISETTVNEWFSRPFRNVERLYVQKLHNQGKLNDKLDGTSGVLLHNIMSWLVNHETPIWTLFGVIFGYIISFMHNRILNNQLYRKRISETIERIKRIIHLPDAEQAKRRLADSLPQFKEKDQIEILSEIGMESSLNEYSDEVTKYVIAELRWIGVLYEIDTHDRHDLVQASEQDIQKIISIISALSEILYNIFEYGRKTSLLEHADGLLQILGMYSIARNYYEPTVAIVGLYESIGMWAITKCNDVLSLQRAGVKFSVEAMQNFKKVLEMMHSSDKKAAEICNIIEEALNKIKNPPK